MSEINKIDVQREITQWSEKDFVRNRYNIWFGSDIPKTISAKEIIDNGIDQAADRKANKIKIYLSKNKVVVFDNGNGISLDKAEGGKTHLYLAVNKLYTSSNYDGTDGLAGTNGVGATATNHLSKSFKSGHIKSGTFTGYTFKNGDHETEGETLDVIENFKGVFPIEDNDKGFYVEAEYSNEILEDDIKLSWINDYIKSRVGELPNKAEVKVIVDSGSSDDEEEGSPINEYTYDKIKGSPNYIKSWEESVKEIPTAVITRNRGGWRYAYCEEGHNFNGITSIVQGSPVSNPTSISIPFEIEDYSVSMRVPVTFMYRGKVNPPYTDQTKQRVTMRRLQFEQGLKSIKKLYLMYKNEAELQYLASMISDSKTSQYMPASSSPGEKELIIAEGYSAISGIKNQRKFEVQACLALKGKFLNVMQMEMKNAIKSDVIRDFINVVLKQNFERIVIATDADVDGAHICTLLLGVLYRFAPKYLREGRVYYCKTPLYVFNKGKDMKWSDKAADCPAGYKVSVKKGLGSFSNKEVKHFITDPNTRELWQFSFDGEEDVKALELALISGGKEWIIK